MSLATVVGLVTASVAITATPAIAAVTCAGKRATIVGSSGRDTLIGTPGADVIVARGGPDLIRGRGGNDVICAGGGDDRIYAGRGADRVYAGSGRDIVDGGPGADDLRGGSSVDTLRVVSSNDAVIDLAQGWASGNGIDALDGFEVLAGSGKGRYDVRTAFDTQAVTISGNHEDTVRTVDAGEATTGNRLTLALGQGSDVYVIRQPDVVVVEDIPGASGGRDAVDITTNGTTTVNDGYGGLRVDAVGTGQEVMSVRATGATVYLDTGAGDDQLDLDLTGGSVTWFAGPGDDTLSGSLPANAAIRLGQGSDTITDLRSLSTDRVDGAAGVDRILGSTGKDQVDLVQHLWKWGDMQVQISSFEWVDGGAGADSLRGGGGPNTLLGGPGSDALHGRAGEDHLDGGPGMDWAYGGAGKDWCDSEIRSSCEGP